MSAIDEVASALQSVIEKLDDASGATSTAGTEADEAIGQAVALGATSVAAGLSVVKESVESLTQQIAAAIDTANQALTAARGAADGT